MMLAILVSYSSQIQGGLAVSLRQLLILDHAKTEKTLKKGRKVYNVFFGTDRKVWKVLDIPVIKGQLALNIPKRASHNSF